MYMTKPYSNREISIAPANEERNRTTAASVHTLTDEHTVSTAPLNDASTADANLQSKRDRKRLDLSSTQAQCCDEAPERGQLLLDLAPKDGVLG